MVKINTLHPLNHTDWKVFCTTDTAIGIYRFLYDIWCCRCNFLVLDSPMTFL